MTNKGGTYPLPFKFRTKYVHGHDGDVSLNNYCENVKVLTGHNLRIVVEGRYGAAQIT